MKTRERDAPNPGTDFPVQSSRDFKRSTRLLLATACLALSATAALSASDLRKAEELYRTTQYAPALGLLNRQTSDAKELELLGRIFCMQGDYHQATDFLTKASEADPTNSRYADWLGRAWGLRASTAGPLSAAGYASKARTYFEQAVQLDPKNQEALADVFEFYLQAPGIMGGGVDKAIRVAEQIAALDPAEGYLKQAQIAERKKELQAAEQNFHRAIEAAPKKVGYQLNLAQFLAKQGRTAESDAVFEKAERDFPNAPRVWLAHAGSLVRQKRNPDQAKELLRKYLDAPLTSDDPPRRDAEKLMAKVSGG